MKRIEIPATVPGIEVLKRKFRQDPDDENRYFGTGFNLYCFRSQWAVEAAWEPLPRLSEYRDTPEQAIKEARENIETAFRALE